MVEAVYREYNRRVLSMNSPVRSGLVASVVAVVLGLMGCHPGVGGSSVVDAKAREGMDGAAASGGLVGDAGGSTSGKGGSTGTGGAKDGGGVGGTSGVGGASGTAGSSGGSGGSGTAGASGTGGATGGGGSTTTASAFPVVYSANSRYLQDQHGTPFPIMGRTAWFVISLSPADYGMFLDNTVARGYNAIEMHVLDHDPRGNHAPFDGNGDAPFLKQLDGSNWNGSLTATSTTSMPDFTTPNPTFWAYVDTFLAACDARGLLVFFFPAYMGASGTAQGWSGEMVANGNAKMKTYGAFIANRYKAQKNLVWMIGGDMGTSSGPFNAAQLDAESGFVAGLKSVTGQSSLYYSAEWASPAIATDQTNFGSMITLNGAYSWAGDVNTEGRLAYAYTPVIPSFLLEEPYDEEGPDGTTWNNSSATQPVRRFQWWGWLSTTAGYISGNGYVWPFNPTSTGFESDNWKNHLNTQGAQDMARLNAFMKSFTWWQLVPSGLGGMKTLVTAGAGAVADPGYVAAAATPTGTLLIAYVPPAHTGSITIDMTAMSGVSRARWFNPTTAAYTVIGSSYANTGTQTFTPPGDNGTGFKDWVLVIDKP